MSDFPPLSPELESEIAKLSDDLEPLRLKQPRKRHPQFDDRRHALLEKHLGHASPRSADPLVCIGDSNTMFFAGAERLRFIRYRRSALLKPHWINRGLDLLPTFRVFHLGPATAWKAGDFGSSTRAREKLEILLKKDVKPAAPVLLSFGEIDCRIHMVRAIQGGRKLDETVERTAAKYAQLPADLKKRGFRPIIWAPPQIIPKDENLTSPTFPFVGPWELRRDITYAYTEALAIQLAKLGVPMVSIAGKYHDPQVKADPYFFPDTVHLSQCVMPLALQELSKAGALPGSTGK